MYNFKKNYSNFYSVTSFSRDQSVIAWLDLNVYDNSREHFATTFATALSYWNLALAVQIRKGEVTFAVSDNHSFWERFKKEVKKTPLLLLVNNPDIITDEELAEFLNQLLNLHVDGLDLIFIYEKSLLPNQKSKSFTEVSKTPFYFSLGEEAEYYVKQNLTLTRHELMIIHSFTNGWPAAVKVAAEILLTRGTLIISNFKNYLNHWVGTIFFGYYSIDELIKLVCLSFLDEIPPEFIGRFFGWYGESLPAALEKNPILRYNIDTKCYYFAAHVQDILKERQIMLESSEKNKFNLFAALWYKERGDVVHAITHYEKVKAYPEIYRLMREGSAISSRELANCYINAINNMPIDFIEKNPYVHIICCCMLSTLYRYDDVYLKLKRLCETHDKGSKTTPEMKPVLGEAYLLWGNACVFSGRTDENVADMYRRANYFLPNGSRLVSPKANLYADRPVIYLSNPETDSLQKNLENLMEWQPEMSKAARGGMSGAAQLAAAEVNFYTRNFKEVEPHARQGIREGLEHEQYHIVCGACFLLMRLSIAKGNYKKTMNSLEMLKQYAAEAKYEQFFSMPDLAVSWLNLRLGRIYDIADWLKDETLYHKKVIPWNYGRDRVVYVTYLLMHHLYEKALAYTDSTIELFSKRNNNLLNIHMFIAQAYAFFKLDEPERAAQALETVYLWCYKNNILMPVVEFGSMTAPLINNYKESGRTMIPEEWLSTIAVKSHSYANYQYNIRKQYERIHGNMDSVLGNLTLEEQEILYLICQGMTDQNIADIQKKTYGTIRAVVRRIYVKINAHGRSEAIKIALDNNIENRML